MALYLGRGQIAECMRSGKKCLASELVRDGRNPGLLVLPEWADPSDPQEKPYIPDDIEGMADYPMAPDNLPPTDLVLTGVYNPNGSFGSDVVLLLHFDGTNGSTTWLDSSGYAHTGNLGFNAQISTTHAEFGTASFTGTSGSGFARVTTHDPLASEFSIINGKDFSIEGFFYRVAHDPDHHGCLFSLTRAPNAGVEIYVEKNTGLLKAVVNNAAGTTIVTLASAANLDTGAWHHWALGRVGTTYSLYLDGTRVATSTAAGTVMSSYTQCSIGMMFPGEGNSDPVIDGWIDEVRYLNGSCAYNGSTYTVPTAAFTAPAVMGLSWNLATLWGPRAKSYDLRRSTDGAAYVTLSTNLVDYTNSTGHVAGLGVVPDYGHIYYVAQSYNDLTTITGPTYTYQVAAVDDDGDDVATSNLVTLHNGVVTGNPSGGDSSFANVVLLMHGDGANNGTVFTDSSSYAHSMTNNGATPNIITTTAQFKYGTASIFAPTSANYMGLVSGLGAEWAITNTATDFTLEMFFQQVAWNGAITPRLFELGNSLSSDQINLNLANGGGFNYLRAWGGPGNGDVYDTFSLPKTPITSGVWHYATLMRKTNVYYLFLDGTLLGSVTPAVGALPTPTYVTVASSGATSAVDQVYVDEVRFTVGVARYPITGPVPVPTAAFPNF